MEEWHWEEKDQVPLQAMQMVENLYAIHQSSV